MQRSFAHSERTALCRLFFFFPELFVQVLIYLRLGQADVRREKEQTSLVCFFLIPLVAHLRDGLQTSALVWAFVLGCWTHRNWEL